MTLTAAQFDAITALKLTALPVAMAFLPGPPNGLSRIATSDPAGCSYWRRASEGQAFYTAPDDHANCPIGAYTHGVALTAEQGAQLQSMLGTMIELKYIKSDEVPAVPHRTAPLEVVAYAPLANATFTPDVVIFRGNVRQIMLLSEAAGCRGLRDRFGHGTAGVCDGAAGTWHVTVGGERWMHWQSRLYRPGRTRRCI